MHNLIAWVLATLADGHTAADPVYTPIPRPEDDTQPFSPVRLSALDAEDMDAEDTQPYYPARLHNILDAASGDQYRNEGFDTPTGEFDQ